MAIFLLIAHNLIQKGVIQAKSGINGAKATLFRLIAATLTAIAVAPFFETTDILEKEGAYAGTSQPIIEALHEWALATLGLSAKIFVIIVCILTLLEILKTFDLINSMLRILNPLLKLMGLNQKVGFL